jgi:hypothetical protein
MSTFSGLKMCVCSYLYVLMFAAKAYFSFPHIIRDVSATFLWHVFIQMYLRIYMSFRFYCQTQETLNNWLTFYCAYLSLLVVQCRYIFRLLEPSSGDYINKPYAIELCLLCGSIYCVYLRALRIQKICTVECEWVIWCLLCLTGKKKTHTRGLTIKFANSLR